MSFSLIRLTLVVSLLALSHGATFTGWAEDEINGDDQQGELFQDLFKSVIQNPEESNSDKDEDDCSYDGKDDLWLRWPPKAKLIHEWMTVEYKLGCPGVEEILVDYGEYVPHANWISGIDVYKDEVYITAPRVKNARGIPSGLNRVVKKDGKSLLEPYPNLSWHRLGRCSALQMPMSIEIDPNSGYMYVIDAGRVGITSSTPGNYCPAKIMILNLNDNGRLVRSHDLPDSVVSRTSNFLNDIVLDYVTPDGPEVRYAYMTDTGDASLVVFDFQRNSSWIFKDKSMQTDENSVMTINGVNYTLNFPINGIAMSPNFDYVYYSVIGSKKLFQIPTSVLRNKDADFGTHVRDLGEKAGSSDGMIAGKKNIYYGALERNAVYEWQRSRDIESQKVSEGQVNVTHERKLDSDHVTMQWPDSFTLDVKGYLWFTSERAQLFLNNKMDFSGSQGANFRIFRIYVDDVSYLTKPKNVKQWWDW
ncbi:protein yellow [Aplysia californica]|uniref:Protein yellow n=1 Tax=Aplysia californica TaxID=6500 RepID=A0ABM1A5W5_APLCA|nr:protein yellow [Aplysia californica]